MSRVVIPIIGMSTQAGPITIRANLAEPQNRGDGRNGGGYSFYLNGSGIATGTYGGLTSLPSTTDIGNNGGSSKQSFHGLMDDVQVYNKSLSVTKIQQLYQEITN